MVCFNCLLQSDYCTSDVTYAVIGIVHLFFIKVFCMSSLGSCRSNRVELWVHQIKWWSSELELVSLIYHFALVRHRYINLQRCLFSQSSVRSVCLDVARGRMLKNAVSWCVFLHTERTLVTHVWLRFSLVVAHTEPALFRILWRIGVLALWRCSSSGDMAARWERATFAVLEEKWCSVSLCEMLVSVFGRRRVCQAAVRGSRSYGKVCRTVAHSHLTLTRFRLSLRMGLT